jgi:hypothetical protein
MSNITEVHSKACNISTNAKKFSEPKSLDFILLLPNIEMA